MPTAQNQIADIADVSPIDRDVVDYVLMVLTNLEQASDADVEKAVNQLMMGGLLAGLKHAGLRTRAA